MGAPGTGAEGIRPSMGAGGATTGAGLRAARFSRSFLRFSIFLSFSSMRTVMYFRTASLTRRRRSTSLTVCGPAVNCMST